MRHLFLLTALVAAFPAIAETPLAENPVVEVPDTASVPAVDSFLTEIQGRWAVDLTEQQVRDLSLMRLAIAETPPKKKDLKKLAMTAEEQVAFGMLAAMVQSMEPTDPDLALMRKATAGAEHATIEFHDFHITRAVPGLELTALYDIVSDTADSASIQFTPEGEPTKVWTMRRDGEGIVAGAEGEAPIRYTRVAP